MGLFADGKPVSPSHTLLRGMSPAHGLKSVELFHLVSTSDSECVTVLGLPHVAHGDSLISASVIGIGFHGDYFKIADVIVEWILIYVIDRVSKRNVSNEVLCYHSVKIQHMGLALVIIHLHLWIVFPLYLEPSLPDDVPDSSIRVDDVVGEVLHGHTACLFIYYTDVLFTMWILFHH